MPDATWAFLQKILGAMQLRPQDVKVSNIASDSWKNYSQDSPVPYQQVWAFGETLPTVFPALPTLKVYEPHTAEGITYLRSDSLEVLQNDTDRKKQLWTALQGLMKG
jgi:DNA polymerase III psi subunit